jgi:hypothetical protein
MGECDRTMGQGKRVRVVEVALTQGSFAFDATPTDSPNAEGHRASNVVVLAPMLNAGAPDRYGLELEVSGRYRQFLACTFAANFALPVRTLAIPLPVAAASSRAAIGAAHCRSCGAVELPGQIRHSFVHASLRLSTQPDYLEIMPRGPFYASSREESRRSTRGKHAAPRRHPSRHSVASKVASGLVGMALVGGAAYGVTNWIVGLNAGSSAEGQGAAVSNLTIAAVSSPSATNLLYPGANGDVVLTITNPNVFPVTITGVDLPTNLTYATGYTLPALTGAIAGCASGTSDVIWNFSTSTSGSVHTLSSVLVVGASTSLVVTMTNDASMTTAAPAACEAAYFSMPSLTGVVATGGAATATTSPTTDSWTS